MSKQHILSILLLASFVIISGCETFHRTPSPAPELATKRPAPTVPETSIESGSERTVTTTPAETSAPSIATVKPRKKIIPDTPKFQTAPAPDLATESPAHTIPEIDVESDTESTVTTTPAKTSAPSIATIKPRKKIVPDTPKFQTALPSIPKVDPAPQSLVEATCKKIAVKLASVGFDECMSIGLSASDGRSRKGIPILQKEYAPKPGVEPLGRVLFLGGTHGDELTSVTSVFKWMKTLDRHHSGKFHWMVAPLVNPDGMLHERSLRINGYGVDLNRNLPTPFWETRSKKYWLETGRDRRYYPGPEAASEPETKWLIQIIQSFKPDVIVSVHAPLEHVDYDSKDRSLSPSRIGNLYRNLMGVFPGSLGNYAGVQRNIPVITLELPHLWVMDKPSAISYIWTDLVYWLDRHMPVLDGQRLAQKNRGVRQGPRGAIF